MSFEDWDCGVVEGELAEMYDGWAAERQQHKLVLESAGLLNHILSRERRHRRWALEMARIRLQAGRLNLALMKTLCQQQCQRAELAEVRVGKLEAEVARLREAARGLLLVLESAGLLNLSNGVQLGQTSWYVKATEAVDLMRAALTPPEAQGREPAWKRWPCIHGPQCDGRGIDCGPDTRKRCATGEQEREEAGRG